MDIRVLGSLNLRCGSPGVGGLWGEGKGGRERGVGGLDQVTA
jgi:hypothetical protein